MTKRSPFLPIAAIAAVFLTGVSFVFLWRSMRTSTPVVERPVTPRGDLAADEKTTIAIFQAASPSVVHITRMTTMTDLRTFSTLEVPEGTGSGFVWDELGHVVTNFHVIQGADKATVTLSDHTTWDATVVGAAPDKDLAVLKIAAPNLRPIPLGTSNDLQVGQKVFAIGNPFGLDQTLTTGVISAIDRTIESVTRRPIGGVIQTDAAINPGNSGGALLDSAGRLIGVNAAIYSSSGASVGIGFAIPVDTVRALVPQIIAHGRVVRPVLGFQPAEESIARRFGVKGVLVMEVSPGGGAAKAGLKPTTRDRRGRIQLGDVITAVGGKPVANANDIYLVLENNKVGDVVTLSLLRDGQKLDVKVTLSADE